MHAARFALPLLLAAAALAAPGGGKVPWGQQKLEDALHTARYERKPVALFFTADWCGYCKELAAGALSDEGVVAAAKGVIPVMVDCTEKGAHMELHQRYGVSSYPTIVMLDPDGKGMTKITGARPAADVKGMFEACTKAIAAQQKPRPKPTPAGPKPAAEPAAPGVRVKVQELPSLEAAQDKAREEGKLLGLVYTLPEAERREKDTQATVEALCAPALRESTPRILWVWRPLCDELGLDTPEAEAYRVSKSPSVAIVDPWSEKKANRHPALVSVNKLADLPGDVARALVEAARAGHPPAAEDEKPAPGPAPGKGQ